jgi:hypothetical protein
MFNHLTCIISYTYHNVKLKAQLNHHRHHLRAASTAPNVGVNGKETKPSYSFFGFGLALMLELAPKTPQARQAGTQTYNREYD